VSEEWRPVVGYEGRYEVSSRGRVRGKYGLLKSRISKIGYDRARLYRPDAKAVEAFVHGLVASAFIGPRPTGMQVNHKDGNKTNNVFENLEYVTALENIRHAMRTGLRPPIKYGDGHGSSRLTSEKVRSMRRLYDAGNTVYDLGFLFSVAPMTAWRVVSGNSWRFVQQEVIHG
jgi:hypothetical protein